MILFNNDFIVLEEIASRVRLFVLKENFQMKEFTAICDNIPRIKLTQFAAVKNALELPS
ncbi:MAG: hypothetical protein JEZ08_15260 [Clostridiales bacterium]|nr:hypothetical protein [Clostridiales bacterium]